MTVNIVFLFIGVTFIELIFGGWIRPKQLNQLAIIKDKTLNYDATGLYPNATSVEYKRDHYGLRGEYGNNPANINVLTVGGSTTDQRYIREEETWQEVLEKLLKESGRTLEVVNAGVDGQSTYAHIKNFDVWFPNIPDLKPNYYLYYVGINDIYVNPGMTYDRMEYDSGSLKSVIKNKSAVYQMVRKLYGAYLAMRVLKIGHENVDFEKLNWTTKPLQDNYDTLMGQRINEYKERLQELCTRTIDQNSIPIFVTQPTMKYKIENNVVYGVDEKIPFGDKEINGVDYYHILNRINQSTMEICRQNNGICIDVSQDTEWIIEDFYDTAHMTPAGAHKLGRALFNALTGEERFKI